MVQFTDLERRLIHDLRILLDHYDCELVVEVDHVREPGGGFHEHHTGIITGPGIALLVDAELARAVMGDDGPRRADRDSPVENPCG